MVYACGFVCKDSYVVYVCVVLSTRTAMWSMSVVLSVRTAMWSMPVVCLQGQLCGLSVVLTEKENENDSTNQNDVVGASP